MNKNSKVMRKLNSQVEKEAHLLVEWSKEEEIFSSLIKSNMRAKSQEEEKWVWNLKLFK